MTKFFSHDWDNNTEFHDTLDEAKAAARKALDDATDLAPDDGWPENTGDICYGVVLGRAHVVKRMPWKEYARDVLEHEDWETDDRFSEYVDWQMSEVSRD